MLQISKNIASRKYTLSISFFFIVKEQFFLLILNRLSKIQLAVKLKINLKLLFLCIFVKDKGNLHVKILLHVHRNTNSMQNTLSSWRTLDQGGGLYGATWHQMILQKDRVEVSIPRRKKTWNMVQFLDN